MDNKYIFSKNLKRLMTIKNVNRKEIAEVLGISYFTISDWVNGKKYPRMDKVELLANYFGVLKSDLIEMESDTIPSSQTLIITEEEKLMLELFREVPEDKQQMVIQMVKVALSTK